MDLSTDARRRAYTSWLRTGHWPTIRTTDGIEHKFNPWHDPADGRFTFASGGRQASDRQRSPRSVRRVSIDPMMSAASMARSKQPTKRTSSSRHPVTEFAERVGEGVATVARDTATGLYSALTTNPKTTIRHSLTGVAASIDAAIAAIAAEDTPARVQVQRAAHAIAHASPRDLGRATGSTIATTALALAPEAAAAKISTLRAIRRANLRPQYKPPELNWAKEVSNSKESWKIYNDSAPGARTDQAPTIRRTMPDGSKRPVKFDGIDGDYLIDRKKGVRDAARSRAQLMRQEQALKDNGLFAIWEVPNEKQKKRALRLFKKMDAKRLKVRIVKL